ncbi:hypothetical protein [Desulfospira joergensenii]|uniref:hypothetical protein n=1 Tax=Desulfospira joergensenii TaxID=53329 RepID=UPI0004272616|nr:hypothetical protein [Desulfospira joergensenii]
MKKIRKQILWTAAVLFLSGCAHTAYLGFHGKSIKSFPEIHKSAVSDTQCLGCHDPDNNPQGPPTPHPDFIGCLKCHND